MFLCDENIYTFEIITFHLFATRRLLRESSVQDSLYSLLTTTIANTEPLNLDVYALYFSI